MQTLDNVVGVAGTLTELNRTTDLYGIPFNGYTGTVRTPRASGITDDVLVAIPSKAFDVDSMYNLNLPEDVLGISFEEAVDHSIVLLTGKMQTLKDFDTGHVTVIVLVDYIAICKNAEMQNGLEFTGVLARDPIYRETPRGREIADLMVKLPCELAQQTCRIPAICWGNDAKRVTNWKAGDTVHIKGRYQSRDYIKRFKKQGSDDYIEETRTANEVSVIEITRIGE